MPGNVISYELLDRINEESGFLWQGDYGQRMKLTGMDLPVAYTVHFANSSKGSSVPSIGDATGVAIPDQVLTSGKTVYFWLFLHPDANSGQTVYANMIKVHPRTALPTIDPPTPAEQSILDQLMAALEAGISQVNAIVEAIPGMVDDEIELKKDEFKGDPGAVFTPAVVDGIMIWTNNGGLPNPDPIDLRTALSLDGYATKDELNTKANASDIGQPNGIAALDSTGRVPSAQLPSYVDDVLEFPSVSQFPNPGESGKIYISTSNNHQYRWTGTQYIDITSGDMETRKADKRDTVLETTLSRGRAGISPVGVASIAFGNSVEASGDYSVSIGQSTIAAGECSSAVGGYTKAHGRYSSAENAYATASAEAAHAEGYFSVASGYASHAEGNNAQAIGNNSHAEGQSTKAYSQRSHAEGAGSIAEGVSSHAEGSSTHTYGDSAHSEGSQTVASSDYSHAEGYGGEFTSGSTTVLSGAFGDAAHSEGYYTRAQGYGAHSEGGYTYANSNYAHAEGYNTRVTASEGAHAEGRETLASGLSTHAEGYGSTAQGHESHAEGYNTTATGAASHSEGGNTTASGVYSHAEGIGGTASGAASHAEGTSTANGIASHAEGSGTVASGDYGSHAEGAGTQATGDYAHAEGGGSRATGMASHAEGSGTYATGQGAHVEGGGSTASGEYSHAQNQATTASGRGSTSEGYGTVASGSYSSVGGLHNIADSYDNWTEWTQGEHCVPGDKRKRTRIVDEEIVIEGFVCAVENTDADWDATHWINQYGKMNYSVIIGNGVSDTNGFYTKSNAYCLDWDGNGYFAGDVYIGCNSDGSGGTKLENTVFATDNEVQAIISGYGVSA